MSPDEEKLAEIKRRWQPVNKTDGKTDDEDQ